MSADGDEIKAVLFDIDGTLISTGGAGASAWSQAFEQLHGVPVDIEEVTESGMTDSDVGTTALRSVLDRDPEPEELSAAMSAYLRYLPGAVADSDGYVVMPAIEQTLDRLSSSGVLLGLTTGNVEAAAHIKLARADLNGFFAFGGYGSDSDDRIELTGRAVERGRNLLGKRVEPGHFISVGDTPRDVDAGHGAGIRVVSVATGNFDAEVLRAAGGDWVIETVAEGFPV